MLLLKNFALKHTHMYTLTIHYNAVGRKKETFDEFLTNFDEEMDSEEEGKEEEAKDEKVREDDEVREDYEVKEMEYETNTH